MKASEVLCLIENKLTLQMDHLIFLGEVATHGTLSKIYNFSENPGSMDMSISWTITNVESAYKELMEELKERIKAESQKDESACSEAQG